MFISRDDWRSFIKIIFWVSTILKLVIITILIKWLTNLMKKLWIKYEPINTETIKTNSPKAVVKKGRMTSEKFRKRAVNPAKKTQWMKM